MAGRRRAGWSVPVPVLFLTGATAQATGSRGLAVGDDYPSKPFALAELVVRVRNLCRWAGGGPPPVLRHAGLEIDPERYEARRDGRRLSLARKEFLALERLVQPTSNVLDVLIAGLRRKLGKPPVLHTVRGVGHLLR